MQSAHARVFRLVGLAVHHRAQADLLLGDAELLVRLDDRAAGLGQRGDRLGRPFEGALADQGR